MNDFSIVDLLDAGAGVALIAAFLWTVTRCEIRIDCHRGDDNETGPHD